MDRHPLAEKRSARSSQCFSCRCIHVIGVYTCMLRVRVAWKHRESSSEPFARAPVHMRLCRPPPRVQAPLRALPCRARSALSVARPRPTPYRPFASALSRPMMIAPPPPRALLRQMSSRSAAKAPQKEVDVRDQALKLMDEGEMVKAASIWSSVLERSASGVDHEALFYRGECYLVEERYAEAEADYRAAIAADADSAIYHHRLGEALLEQDRATEALAAFERAVALEEAGEYLRGRAQARLMLGERERALADLDAAIELDADAESLQMRGELRAEAGLQREALADYTDAIALDPYDGELWRARAVLRSQLGELEGALEDIQMAVARAPDQAAVHADHGRLLTRLERAAEGRLALEKALQLAPDDANIVASYAATLAALNLGPEAATQYERAINLLPEDKLLQLSLAELRCTTGEWAKAVASLNAILQHADQLPQDMRAAALYHRGRARSELGEKEAALADLSAAVALAPENRSFRFERGNVAMSLGRKEEAAEEFKAARVDEVLALIAEREKEFTSKRKGGGGKV